MRAGQAIISERSRWGICSQAEDIAAHNMPCMREVRLVTMTLLRGLWFYVLNNRLPGTCSLTPVQFDELSRILPLRCLTFIVPLAVDLRTMTLFAANQDCKHHPQSFSTLMIVDDDPSGISILRGLALS